MEKHSFLYSIVILIFQNFGVSINFEKEQKCQKLKKKNETKYLYTDKTLDFL